MHCFRYDDLAECHAGSVVRLDKEENGHLFKTLRAAPGDHTLLMDGNGLLAEAEVIPGKELVICSIEKKQLPAAPFLHMYIAPPRRQKMDQILRQATELGVYRIIPMISERSVSLPDQDSVNGRWKEILFDACKQSGNPYLPQVSEPIRFADALKDAQENCERRFFGSVAECPPNEEKEKVLHAAWFVGPEGGFTREEEQQLLDSGVEPLHFGNWILRVETAAVCGLALIHSNLK
ncbi:MAG: 16S rRNA (uracil(1498)-N(3))-methyltransferase [Lentisphaeria bacterium]|nr:16S rRNA (uracil(1498)-N(3))-methyltransferase [Lentisphaeria bacterium]